MMSMYQQLDAISRQVQAAVEQRNRPVEPIRDRILQLVKQRPNITTPEMSELLDRSPRSLSSDISKLLREGWLIGKKMPKSHFVAYRIGKGIPPKDSGKPTCEKCIMDIMADGKVYTTTMLKKRMNHSINTIRQTASAMAFKHKIKLVKTEVSNGIKTHYYQKL